VMGKIDKLPVSALTRDLNLQPRERIDDTTVATYAEDIASGAKMPAVVVFDDGTKRYWLADGFHRCEAALKAHGEGAEVEVDLRKGDGDAAFLFSLGANAEHGLRRTNADIKRTVQRAIARYAGHSDRQIAKLCKVSDKTVKAHRPAPTAEVPQFDEKRKGADGKERKLPAKKPAASKPPVVPAAPAAAPPKAPVKVSYDRGAGGDGDDSQDVPDDGLPVVEIPPAAPVVEDKPPTPFSPVLFPGGAEIEDAAGLPADLARIKKGLMGCARMWPFDREKIIAEVQAWAVEIGGMS